MINGINEPSKEEVFYGSVFKSVLKGINKAKKDESKDFQTILNKNELLRGMKIQNSELESNFDDELIKEVISNESLIVPFKHISKEYLPWILYVWDKNGLITIRIKNENCDIEIKRINVERINQVTLVKNKNPHNEELSFEAHGEKYKLCLNKVPENLLSVYFEKPEKNSTRYTAMEIDFKNTFKLLEKKLLKI